MRDRREILADAWKKSDHFKPEMMYDAEKGLRAYFQ